MRRVSRLSYCHKIKINKEEGEWDKKEIKQEIKKGIIPDPSTIDPITGEPLPQPEGAPVNDLGQNPTSDMGQIPVEPDLESQTAVVDAQAKKDLKKAEI